MLIRIDTVTGAPIWQQIVNQVTRQVLSGTLKTGDRLPTVRELAGDLRINPNTVARAYQDLERDGVVETRRGAGTFVCDFADGTPPAELKRIIEEQLRTVVVEALHLNIAPSDISSIFNSLLLNLSKSDIPKLDINYSPLSGESK